MCHGHCCVADPLVELDIQREVAGDGEAEVRDVLDDAEFEVSDGDA